MQSGTLSGILTALLLVLFIGLCIWAFSRRRRNDFDEASRLPLDDDDAAGSPPRDESEPHP